MPSKNSRRGTPALLAALGSLVLLVGAAPARAALPDLYSVRAGTAVGLSLDGGIFESSGEKLASSGTMTSRPAAGTAPFTIAAGPGVARTTLAGSWTNPPLFTFSFAPQTTATARTALTVTGPPGSVTTSLNLRVGGTVLFDCPISLNCQTSVGVDVTVLGRLFRTQAGVNVASRNDLGLTVDPIPGGFELTGTVTTPPFTVQANEPFEVTLSVRLAVGLGGKGLLASANWSHDFGTGGRGVSFAPVGPVLNVPGGYDVSGASVTGNRWRDPFAPDVVDLTPPVVAGVPARGPDGREIGSGREWYRSPVLIDWRAVDPEPSSGMPSDPADTLAATEGAELVFESEPSCDPAGNCATGRLVLSLDMTPPTLTCEEPTPVFVAGGEIALVTAAVADGLSGVLSVTAGTADTSSVGEKTVQVSAFDAAGNEATTSCPYRVEYVFDGFAAPVANAPELNVVRAGRAVPLKWRLTDASGTPVSDLSDVSVTAVSRPCDAGTTRDEIAEDAAGASGLQKLGDGWYQFNWLTPKSYAGSCKTLRLDLGEGAFRTAAFEFRP